INISVAKWSDQRGESATKHRKRYNVTPLGRSDFDGSFERKLGRASQRHVRELFSCSFEIDAELASTANDHVDWSIRFFRRSKNQRTGDNARATGERFVFHAALISTYQNLLWAALLDKIHIR